MCMRLSTKIHPLKILLFILLILYTYIILESRFLLILYSSLYKYKTKYLLTGVFEKFPKVYIAKI